MEKDSENHHLLQSKNGILYTDERSPETRVYKRRWWVLALFSLASIVQAMVWNTWAPIAESAELVFDWSDGNVAMITSLANISYVVLVLPMCMVMDTKGLRFAIFMCASSLVICTSIRCFTFEPTTFTAMAYVCHLIQGLAGTTTFAGPALLASVWFPLEQRPTATAIVNFFNYFGVSISFIIGPQLVPGPRFSDNTENATNYTMIRAIYQQNNSVLYTTSPTVTNLETLKSGIANLMYAHCGISVGLFILVLVYFPAKPPHPPSITASIERINYKQALMKIGRNGPLWVIVLAGAFPVGVAGTWIAVIDVVVKPLGVSQIDAGWMGFWNTLIGCFFGIIITKFSDFFYRRRKLFLISLFMCASGCCIWFALLCMSIIEFNLPALYASCILLGIFVNGTTPLFYEMTAEASYPVAEGVTGGFYTMVHDIFGAVLLLFINVSNIGTDWMTWTVLGSLCVSICLLLAFPERYNRSDIDLGYSIDVK